MLVCTTVNTSIAYLIIAHVILMIGCPLAMSPAQTYALNSLEGPQSGDGSTIMNTMQQIVGAIATALATSLLGIGQVAYQNHFGKGHLNAAFTNGTHYGFYFTIALIIVGLILSFSVKSNKKVAK